MKIRLGFAGVIVIMLGFPAWGGAMIQVGSVQLPAWVERDGKRAPLTAGIALKEHDLIQTGAQARLQLQLSEGSVVKLGENASFRIETLPAQTEKNSIFQAALEVAKGAFRYTTSIASKFQKRDVRIRVATVTAGIRGTDIWGKAAADKDIVCLLEGKISVSHGEQTLTMQDPMTFYIAPHQGEPLPIAALPDEKIKQWMLETELLPATPKLTAQGKWRATLATFNEQQSALALYDQLSVAGYPSKIVPRKAKGAWVYQVQVQRLATKQDAIQLAQQLKAQFNLTKT